MSEKYLTVKEAALTLKVSGPTIRRYIHSNQLKASKDGVWKIKQSDLDAFINISTESNTDEYYLTPIIKVSATFEEAAELQESSSEFLYFDEESNTPIDKLIDGHRSLIVGEPGVGKSLLLRKIRDCFNENRAYDIKLVNLKDIDCEVQIDKFLVSKSNNKVLLLDALDEVQSNKLPFILQKIDLISRDYIEVPIFLTSRWVFIKRYASTFPTYKYITISPFTREQVKDYLIHYGNSEDTVDELMHSLMSFDHQMLVLQIPRYLYFLKDFLNKNGLTTASRISRNELFEYFIYTKLDHEDSKFERDKKAIVKRLLEKLALTMEIYQTNVITKDELMTFFDELNSDLKLIALSQIDLEIFFDYSLLKNNIDTVEFDNTEFQEYLAAKEITRLPDPSRAAFEFATDKEVNEIYPSWLNALTFLVDMEKDLIGQLMDFSGIRSEDFKVVDESFLTFLSRVNVKDVNQVIKDDLLNAIIKYHKRTKQWITGSSSTIIPHLYKAELETELLNWAIESERKVGEERFIGLGNIAYIVGCLFRSGVSLNADLWRERLITYATDDNDNGVLQRHALFALEHLGDKSVIDKLPNLLKGNDLISQSFLSLCATLNPNSPKSISYFVEATKNKVFYSSYGLFAISRTLAINTLLKTLVEDESFRRELLNDMIIFNRHIDVLLKNIESAMDDKTIALSKEAILQYIKTDAIYSYNDSTFISGLAGLLKKKIPNLIFELIEEIVATPSGSADLYYASNIFEVILDIKEVPSYINKLIEVGEKWTAFETMQRIKHSTRLDSEEVYEAGRPLLKDEYRTLENRSTKPAAIEHKQNDKILSNLRLLLNPGKDKYNTAVFSYYFNNADRLEGIISNEDKKRLKKLITEKVFKLINPRNYGIDIKKESGSTRTYVANEGVRLFGEALLVTKYIDCNINPYRQKIIDYIPFANHDQLQTIFELIRDIKPNELSGVLNVYKSKHTDLWRFNPQSLIVTVKQFNLVEAVPVLNQLVEEKLIFGHVREEAIYTSSSLESNPDFLRKIFAQFNKSKVLSEKRLADIANGLLIIKHDDDESIRWRVKEVVDRAAPLKIEDGVHGVGELEDEVRFSQSFAKPLMELKTKGYESLYLEILEDALKLWEKNTDYQHYVSYLWDIVYSYFDNLKEYSSYKPLQLLENKISELKNQSGTNWLAGRMVNLRKSYLSFLGKPRNISEATRKYNDARMLNDKSILNSEDLYQQLQDILVTDIKQWIEGEGAYDLIIGDKVYEKAKQEYEKLVQRTIKAQVENALLKRGFQVDLAREPELLDGKKVDFLVRYGFIGPVVIEVKLSSNSDLKGKKIKSSSSYLSMERYMKGYYATHGVLLVVNNDNSSNLQDVKKVFHSIDNVSVKSFNCYLSGFTDSKKK